MQKPRALYSVKSEAPAAIESRALGTLAYIRTSIESSGSMDVPGMAGIAMGIIGVVTALVVSLPGLAPHWLAIWLAAAALALIVGGASVARQVVRRGQSRYLGPTRKFLLCLCPALLAGAVLTVVCSTAGTTSFIPGIWLLLYGCAVVSASTVTTAEIARLISLMGALFAALGSITLALPTTAHTVMLGLGFGVLHIIFGFLIGRSGHAG